ncbi:MAG TPA: hypothetical protein VN328_00315 [Thermodesulfovibrionales bacterium]|nr:hypothetical protein [Thermodesulfovibrionales bacterium]
MRDNVIVFKTSSFRTEGRSVLHSGIYNRELSSSLAAGAVIVAVGFFFAGYLRITAVYFIITILSFAALFILFRIYVFREPVLETVFDHDKGLITLSLKKVLGGEVQSYPMTELSSVGLGHVTVQPQNIDGIRIVEKIALQHGTVIPGFGKREDFYTVDLDFTYKEVVIFSARERQSAQAVADELRRYLLSYA